MLVGFDFPCGYPRGFADALGLKGRPWRAVWQHLAAAIQDDPVTNANNRFDVAAHLNRRLGDHVFWGRPANSRQLDRLSEDLSVGKNRCRYGPHASGLVEYREVEKEIRKSTRKARPHAVWQLTGVGCVGSQVLTGIPVLEHLVRDEALARVSAVWPFQVGVPERPLGEPSVVHAEIWPSFFDVPTVPGRVPDETQVMCVASELRKRDRFGDLAGLFAAPLAACPVACREEGWILGVI